MPGDRKREFGHGRAVDSLYNGEDDDNGDDDDGENGAPSIFSRRKAGGKQRLPSLQEGSSGGHCFPPAERQPSTREQE